MVIFCTKAFTPAILNLANNTQIRLWLYWAASRRKEIRFEQQFSSRPGFDSTTRHMLTANTPLYPRNSSAYLSDMWKLLSVNVPRAANHEPQSRSKIIFHPVGKYDTMWLSRRVTTRRESQRFFKNFKLLAKELLRVQSPQRGPKRDSERPQVRSGHGQARLATSSGIRRPVSSPGHRLLRFKRRPKQQARDGQEIVQEIGSGSRDGTERSHQPAGGTQTGDRRRCGIPTCRIVPAVPGWRV
ncbi:hypothetical protein EYF80_010736 [Liparis tanakae]|uniref:Uncharacterized protein n=1 Tax=Liparis tanakae TaxID=230148 RepID=A0A4Z2IMR0_9TELE|nr:hypothetical protein EYF80_010736 [Liparis tanakae]